MANSIKLRFGYEGTDFTRQYTISNVADSIAAAPGAIKAKIKAVNASLAGGTSGNLDAFYRSDDFDSAENIGKFNRITAAQLDSTTVTIIDLGNGVEEEGDNNG